MVDKREPEQVGKAQGTFKSVAQSPMQLGLLPRDPSPNSHWCPHGSREGAQRVCMECWQTELGDHQMIAVPGGHQMTAVPGRSPKAQ